jgi:teichuronic acid biosynthesis glycosyltransferase TuaC
MKILTLAAIYPNEQNDSIGRSVAFLDRALARRGIQGVSLFLRPWAPGFLARRLAPWRHLALRNRVEEEEGLTVVFDQYLHLPRRTRLDLSARFMAARAHRLITARGWDFDVIHGQSIFPSALAALFLSRRLRIPFFITLRDDLSHLDNMLKAASPSLKEMYGQMFRRVGAILNHGPSILRDLSRYLPEKRTIPVLLAPNGVDHEGIQIILESLPPAPQRVWGQVVSVGNLFRFKGIHENLEALRMVDQRGFRDWRYTVVGDGPFRQELQALAKDLGLADRVNFIGRVSHREAVRRIHEGDIFCLPSWQEPFGNVYAEAAVCRRPAIGCRGFGAEMTIRDGETGILVPPKDVPALAEALLLLLAHPERARRMGEGAEKHIRQFTWDRTAEIYQRAIGQVLHSEEGFDPAGRGAVCTGG